MLVMGTLYEDRLRQHIGNESEPIEAVDAVCPQMIRHWVEIMEDRNPAYSDPEWAGTSRHGGLVAPGSMMQVWSMAPHWPERPLPDLPFAPVDEALEEAGYTEIVATEQSQTITALAKVGEPVTFTVRLTDVSDSEHKTRLGEAYFVTFEYRFSDPRGDLLGTQSFTYMRYRPQTEDTEEPAA
ncbi:MAG: hypothetical protein DCC48_17730 [Acidobacteria bacterium]|nr:MAG: hypothetical protein DCC48_17730 [Acidobacteriota bacterium]